MKKYIFIPFLITIIIFSSCKKSNEEKIITDYLNTTINDDGSTTKIKAGKYTFHSFEHIDVNGKFIYSILHPNDSIDKSSIENQIKKSIDKANKYYLYGAIQFKRALNCTPSQWREEKKYNNSEKEFSNKAIYSQIDAHSLGLIYNSFDTTTIHLIKAKYDYQLGNMKKEGITQYFVYDQPTNKIIFNFKKLDDKFIEYYNQSIKAIEYNQILPGIEKYDYVELLDLKLDSLISLVDSIQKLNIEN